MSRNVLLIDDHPLFVDGFAAMLWQFRQDWHFVSARHVTAGLAQIEREDRFDLILVDIQLPDNDGFSAVAMIRAADPLVACVIISGREDAAARARAAACGARGYICKSDTPESIVAAIEQVLAGEDLFAPARLAGNGCPALSARQSEVLALLAEGHANKEIRYRLGIAERTVRAHLTDLFGLLGVSSRVQAILKAREIGLID